jgi:hypothetical protein
VSVLRSQFYMTEAEAKAIFALAAAMRDIAEARARRRRNPAHPLHASNDG